MFQALMNTASRMLNRLQRRFGAERTPAPAVDSASPPPPRAYRRLKRVVLTDEVSRTLFAEFAAHRRTARGDEEIGWVLLGVREASEAIVLATLPAGAQRSAGVAHVRFNSNAQAVASRIVRQADKRLALLGVVHTHPGSLRHPSGGDYQGDSLWVGQLRGKEGVFGIGTADAKPSQGTLVAERPHPHVQIFGDFCFSWYALAEGDRRYRPSPVRLTLGPDLAKSLHPVWDVIETHAVSLDRLSRQQANVMFEVVQGKAGPALCIHLKFAEPNEGLRLLLEKNGSQFILVRNNDLIEVDPREPNIERAVYLILAELAAQK